METAMDIGRSARTGRAAPLGRAAAALALVAAALGPGGAPARAQDVSPYAGEEARAIKALSEEQVRGYLEGEGMGWAMAAELNHYPGPRHVLDLADSLGLSAAQRERFDELYGRMNAEAVELGGRIVEREGELDRAFAGGAIDAAELAARVAEIADLQGRLRSAHLLAHVETRAALSPHQVATYDRLRGYAAATEHAGHAH